MIQMNHFVFHKAHGKRNPSTVLRYMSYSKSTSKINICIVLISYYHFSKSRTPWISAAVGSRNMIEVLKNRVWKQLNKLKDWFSRNTDDFLVFFIVFEWAEFSKVQWTNAKWNVRQKLHPDWLSMNLIRCRILSIFSKIPTISIKIASVLKIVGEIRQRGCQCS